MYAMNDIFISHKQKLVLHQRFVELWCPQGGSHFGEGGPVLVGWNVVGQYPLVNAIYVDLNCL